MIIEEDNYLMHYGILRKSGRYPWGSGENEAVRSKDFLGTVAELRKQGLSETEIAAGVGMTTTELRAAKTIAKNAAKQADIAMAQRLKDKGYSNVAIGKRMGINESSVRSLLEPGQKDKSDVLVTMSKMLKEQVDERGFIDVGTGVENLIGVSRTRLDTSIAMLKEEGYVVHNVQIPQVGSNKNNKTTTKVLAPPGTEYRDIAANLDKIQSINKWSEDGGRSVLGVLPPLNISPKRVAVRYAEEGGADADGVIYVRPGVADVSLGGKHYAQVRVAVGGTHFLKGMAMYKDDLPSGVDLMFNTNKSDTGNKLDAMKPMKKKDGEVDQDNPFGTSLRRQIIKELPDGSKKVTSSMNIVYEEGNWDTWSKNLSSQFLSKQSPILAKTQLDVVFENKKADLDEILSLTNPAVRKKLLEDFAEGADSSAVHLKAAGLPRQSSHAILPINSMKENEVYAPNFRPGERVVLIRHPHGGTFEIPELIVNNSHPEARKLLGMAEDAIGINSKVAERLSGADFDGDTVIVIPNNSNKVKSTPALEGLKNFDPKSSYPEYPGMKPMSARVKGQQMGDISNLITDMTIKGATNEEKARAIRHSMVVIDAEKHNLNWKQSAIDNGIRQLKTKYQGGANAGASTLISRAKSRQDVPDRRKRRAEDGGFIDKKTGEKVFVPTGETITKSKVSKRTGEVTTVTKPKMEISKKLVETKDAHTLSSGTPIEKVYADHSNRLKSMANLARKEAVNTKSVPYSKSAKAVYSSEVASLNAKLNIALRNRPLERQAQVLANATLQAKRLANPDMDADEEKKVKFQALTESRNRVGAGKELVTITDREWEAVQAGAITNHKLTEILKNADLEAVKQLAMPRTQKVMTSAKVTRARAMAASGYTQAEIADALGVSLTTLKLTIGGTE